MEEPVEATTKRDFCVCLCRVVMGAVKGYGLSVVVDYIDMGVIMNG